MTSVGEIRHATKVVLEEDDYLAALSAIIEQEFFPHSQHFLGQLDKIEEIDALSSGNPVLIARSLVKRALSQRPAAAAAAPLPQAASPFAHLSLSEFLSSYTSEDNASFEALQLRDMGDRRRACHWLWEPGEADHYEARARWLDPALALGRPEPAVSASSAGQRPGMLMLYHTHGQHLTAEQRQSLDALLAGAALPRGGPDTRPAAPQGGHFRVRNHLMFAPDSDFTHQLAAAGGVGLASASPRALGGGATKSAATATAAASVAVKRIRGAESDQESAAMGHGEGSAVLAGKKVPRLAITAASGPSASSSRQPHSQHRRAKGEGSTNKLSAAGQALAARLHGPVDGLAQMLRESYSRRRRRRKPEHG